MAWVSRTELARWWARLRVGGLCKRQKYFTAHRARCRCSQMKTEIEKLRCAGVLALQGVQREGCYFSPEKYGNFNGDFSDYKIAVCVRITVISYTIYYYYYYYCHYYYCYCYGYCYCYYDI